MYLGAKLLTASTPTFSSPKYLQFSAILLAKLSLPNLGNSSRDVLENSSKKVRMLEKLTSSVPHRATPGSYLHVFAYSMVSLHSQKLLILSYLLIWNGRDTMAHGIDIPRVDSPARGKAKDPAHAHQDEDDEQADDVDPA